MKTTPVHHPPWCSPHLCVSGADHKYFTPPDQRWADFADRLVHTRAASFQGRNGSLEALLVQAEGDEIKVILVGNDPESDVILTAAELAAVSAWLLGLKDTAVSGDAA